MRKILSEHKWLLAILLTALVLRAVYFISVKPWSEGATNELISAGDASEYHTLALKFVENGSYPENIFIDTYRTPGFPVYVAFYYFLFGVKPFIVLLSHIFLNLVSIVFLYALCKKLFENKFIALAAAALFALEPNIIKLTAEFGTETLHATLMLISVYYFLSALKDKKVFPLAVSSVLFGLTVLTRPINLYFYILCLALILFYPGEIFRNKIKYSVVFLVFYFLTIAPWMYRNYNVYGHFSTNSFRGTAVMYNAGLVKGRAENMNVDTAMASIVLSIDKIYEEKNIKNPFDMDEQREIAGKEYILSHIGSYAVLQIKGMKNYFIAPLNNPKYSIKSKIFIGIYFVIIYSLVLIGVYRMFADKRRMYLFILASLVFYFCFLTGIIGLSRYRAPSTPYYLIIASYAVFYLVNFYREKIKLKKQ